MDQEPFYNFQGISAKNWQRTVSPIGFNMKPENDKDMDLYLVACLAQEVGEMSGIITKMRRGLNERELKKFKEKFRKSMETSLDMPSDAEIGKLWLHDKLQSLKKEAADVFGYFDLLLTLKGIDIRREFAKKFNEVSMQMECPAFQIVGNTNTPL